MSGYDAQNVERAARAVFGEGQLARAMEILARVPDRTARVQVAALKLSGGDLAKLAEAVDLSLVDWRDVLAAAEYPEALSIPTWELPDDERRRVSERDLAQYRAWLESVGLDDVRPVGG